jgi:hypothetical protein
MSAKISKKEFEERKVRFLRANWKLVNQVWGSIREDLARGFGEQAIVERARRVKLYSPKTIDNDIARGLKNMYERMKKPDAKLIHWEPEKVKDVRINGVSESEFRTVRGCNLESFSKSKGWYWPKKVPQRNNPASIIRHLLMFVGKYPALNTDERAGWDKTLGEIYLYAEGEVDGVIVDERVRIKKG